MRDVTEIRFRDLVGLEKTELARLKNRRQRLEEMLNRPRGLSSDEEAELERIVAVLSLVDKGQLCDPLMVGVRDMFNANSGLLGLELAGHEPDGKLSFGTIVIGATGKAGGRQGSTSSNLYPLAVTRAALTLGLIIVDGVLMPPVIAGKKGSSHANTTLPDRTAKEYGALAKGFFAAIGETQSLFDLALLVLPLLAQEGDPDGSGSQRSIVECAEFALVMRALAEKGVTTDEPQLRRRVNECLDRIQAVGSDRPLVDQGIDLPDLDTTIESDIVADNVRLMGPMVCAAMFDELKAFEVVDKLVELFQHGMLPIGSGKAGKLLYSYWKEGPNRMSEAERKNFYAMTMGIPGGEAGGMVNRDFNDLWIRFVSSVSAFVRQNEVDKLLRNSMPSSVSGQQVRKAARDLAANLSLHGYGMAFYAAVDLQEQVKTIIDLLSDSDIKSAYGARDMWQVIDQVATLELGGAKTSSRYRTLATCGAIITAWLSNNVTRILRPTGPIIDVAEVLSLSPRTAGPKATKQPTDYDLVNACELWLADTATSDARVEELAQPREAPVMTSKPVQIPAIAREMLDGVGLGMGFGRAAQSSAAPQPSQQWPNGYSNGHAQARH